MKLTNRISVFLLLGLIFSLGIGVGLYWWFPFTQKQTLKHSNDGTLSESSISVENVHLTINQLSRKEILSKRNEISKFIIPNRDIDVSVDFENGTQVISTNYYGVRTRGIFTHDENSKGDCLRIYIQGHGGNPFNFNYFNELKDVFVSKGCDVLSLSMLGLGLNEGAASFPGRFGEVVLTPSQAAFHGNYSSFFDDENPILDPMSLFLYPHMRLITHVLDSTKYEDVSVLGISGGGWYTVWLSALMPELKTSLSYAGSLPMAYRVNVKHHGDWEQVYSAIYRSISYLELYQMMVANNEGNRTRKSFLVYNNNDSCCFMDPAASHFKNLVDGNDYMPKVIVDNNDMHSMNVSLVRSILNDE